jgi:hypothetical protein
MQLRKPRKASGSGRRKLLWMAVAVPVVAGVAWLVRSLRPSAAADEVAVDRTVPGDEATTGATSAPATAAPGQATVSGNGATRVNAG